MNERQSFYENDNEAALVAEQNISQISDDILAMMDALTMDNPPTVTRKGARMSLRNCSLPVIPDEEEEEEPQRYYSVVETQDEDDTPPSRIYSIVVPSAGPSKPRPSSLQFTISPSTSMSSLSHSPTTSSPHTTSPTSYWSSAPSSAHPSEDDSFDADVPNCLPVPPKYGPRPDPISALAASRRLHAARGVALDTLTALSFDLGSLRTSFVPPKSLDFHPPSGIVTLSTFSISFTDVAPFYQLAPGIARTSNNEPARAFRRELRRLAAKLNEVDVAGDASLDHARNELAQAVEHELIRFKWWKARVWSAQDGYTN
jgi:hypothetical protein